MSMQNDQVFTRWNKNIFILSNDSFRLTASRFDFVIGADTNIKNLIKLTEEELEQPSVYDIFVCPCIAYDIFSIFILIIEKFLKAFELSIELCLAQNWMK